MVGLGMPMIDVLPSNFSDESFTIARGQVERWRTFALDTSRSLERHREKMFRDLARSIILSFAAFGLGTGLLPAAGAATLSTHPVAVAVRNGNCNAAVALLNPNALLNDKDTAFIGGRMLSEGICVNANAVGAAHFFAHASDLGDRSATLDFSSTIGKGEGSEQSYDRAGEVCRSAGVDPQKKLSSYTLGYACTVLGVAGAMLRTSLPVGSFIPASGDATVEFNGATGKLKVLDTPRVARGEVRTGSHLGSPLIDAEREIEVKWQAAMAKVPQPDKSRLDDANVALVLDVDMTLERGLDIARPEGDHGFKPLYTGEIQRSSLGH